MATGDGVTNPQVVPITFAEVLSSVLRRPLLCITLMWCGGILLTVHSTIAWSAWLCVALLFLATWWFTISTPGNINKTALCLAVFAVATALSSWQLRPIVPGDMRFLSSGGTVLIGYPITSAIVSPYQWRMTFHVQRQRVGEQWHPVSCNVYLTGRGPAPKPGHAVEILARVTQPEDSGNPVGFSWKAYLTGQGLAYRVYAYECHQLHQTAPSPPLSAVRAQCFTALSRCMPGVYSSLNAQLLTSLVLGVYGTPLPDQLVEQFRQAGIIHLMVVSGSQIALFGGLFLIPFVFIPFGRARTSYPRTRLILLLISLPLLLIYVAIADRGPSVDRALFMVMLAALALCCALSPLGARRSFHPDGITLLAAAALVMLIGNPAIMFNPGMQLSFAAVFGLWSITPVLLRCWHRWPRWIALTLSATLGAQLMTYPVLAWHFGTIPLLAPLTNVFAVPIVGLLLPLGILALLLSMVAPPLAIAVNWLNLPLLRMLLFVSTLGGTNNWGQLLCYVRSPFAIVLYYMALGMSTLMLSHWLDSRVQGWDVPAGREPRMW